MGESIQCWQCGTRMTLDELASNDGDCPRCEVEVHLAEYLDNALSKVATLEAENTKLRAELERRESHWFSLVMNCAAELETASYCMTDTAAKRVAQSGADHYRKQANAAPSAPKADEYRCRKCGEKTPPPEPYKAYVLCDCGYMSSATAAAQQEESCKR